MHNAAPQQAVILRACEGSSTPQLLDFVTRALEYWIIRFRG
jgi:hypothetical protein